MENASKALLIAAGVLIVILIIAMSMRIYNGTGDVASDAEQVGESISESTTDASKEAISSLKDINSKNLLNTPNQTFKIQDYYYNAIATNAYLEPNKKYKIQFDYKIINNEDNYTIYASIGIIDSGKGPDYDKKIIDIMYPNQKEGTCVAVFTYTGNERKQLVARFARINQPGTFEVYISNIELREVK